MGQKYKIFINGKVLFLAQNPAEISEILSTESQYIIQPLKDKKHLDGLMEILLGKINRSSMVIYHANMDKLKETIFSRFTYIEAGGGVVRNHKDQVLLIYRKGFWDLPKGKSKGKEKMEKTAMREVEEETGVGKLKILDPVHFVNLSNKCTYHTYIEEGQYILKASYWYNMTTEYEGKLVPQKEEDITKAKWVNKRDLESYFPEMYPSVVDVLESALAYDELEPKE